MDAFSEGEELDYIEEGDAEDMDDLDRAVMREKKIEEQQ